MIKEVVFKILNRAVKDKEDNESELERIAKWMIEHAEVRVGKGGVMLVFRENF